MVVAMTLVTEARSNIVVVLIAGGDGSRCP